MLQNIIILLNMILITDESVKLLGNCHILDLCYCKITNECLKFLRNCHFVTRMKISNF